jgi:hypothetical protein
MSTLIITCLEGDACQVYFEPYGSEHTLVKGDEFLVEPPASMLEPVAVGYVAGGISVVISSETVPRVTNRAGVELRL